MSTIPLGDDTLSLVKGREPLEVEGGTFSNFPSVPSDSTNLLLLYQINYLGKATRLHFSLEI